MKHGLSVKSVTVRDVRKSGVFVMSVLWSNAVVMLFSVKLFSSSVTLGIAKVVVWASKVMFGISGFLFEKSEHKL